MQPLISSSGTENYFRICPSCESENQAHLMRCHCGALLTGVDLTLQQKTLQAIEDPKIQAESVNSASKSIHASELKPASKADLLLSVKPEYRCQYEDCGQQNPAGCLDCLYCNRALPVVHSQSESISLTQDENRAGSPLI